MSATFVPVGPVSIRPPADLRSSCESHRDIAFAIPLGWQTSDLATSASMNPPAADVGPSSPSVPKLAMSVSVGH